MQNPLNAYHEGGSIHSSRFFLLLIYHADSDDDYQASLKSFEDEDEKDSEVCSQVNSFLAPELKLRVSGGGKRKR